MPTLLVLEISYTKPWIRTSGTGSALRWSFLGLGAPGLRPPSPRGGGTARGNRGAPARGVDVKPLPRGGPGGSKSPKNGVFGVYPPKRRFFAILAKNGQFWPFYRKIAR